MRCDVAMRYALIALAACGGSRSPAATTNARSTGELPALFAQLFVDSEKTFTGELVISHSEATGRVTDKTPGEVTCTISDVQTLAGGARCELACEGLELVDQINGTYVGSARGLWKVDASFDADVATLLPEDALFAAIPARAQSQTDGEDNRSGSAKIVEQHAGGWCAMVTSWGGDESGWQLCLEEGVGIIGGHGFFSGGQSRDAYFGDVRRL